MEANGATIAVFGSSELSEETATMYDADEDKPGIAVISTPEGMDRMKKGITAARDTHDVVVVMLHGGVEATHCSDPGTMLRTRALEEASADAVMMSHAHRLNGGGWQDGAYVHCGLGNFIYYLNYDGAGHTGVLTLTFDIPAPDAPKEEQERPLVTKANWEPLLIGDDGIPRPVDEATGAQLTEMMEGYRSCTPATANPDGKPGPFPVDVPA